MRGQVLASLIVISLIRMKQMAKMCTGRHSTLETFMELPCQRLCFWQNPLPYSAADEAAVRGRGPQECGGLHLPTCDSPYESASGGQAKAVLARWSAPQGVCSNHQLGADIFLADATGCYLGRICQYRECHPRVACFAQHCGRRAHLNDDLHVVTLSKELIAAPPIDLWPDVVRRLKVPPDVEALLLTEVERVR